MPKAYKPELLTNYTPYFKPPPALTPDQVPTLKSPDTICIEFNRKLVPYLLGLLELTRWEDRFEGEEEDQAHTVGLFQELVYELLTASGCGLPDQGQGQQYNFVTVYDFDCDCDNGEDNMIKPMYQKFGNTWYAGFPCGDCGGVEWVPIGTGSPIDPQTGSPSGLASGGISGGITYPASGVTVDCYASKATDYLTNRFVQFISYVKNVSVPLIDNLFGQFDEVIDTGLAIVQITQGDSLSQELAGWTVNQIKSAVTFHRQTLIDNWTYTGEVNRFELEEWITTSIPLLSNGILIRELMLWWLRASLIYGYNKDLALLASECANNTSILTVSEVTVTADFTANLIDYQAVLLSNQGWTITKGEGTVELIPASEVPINVVGLAWNIAEIVGQASCGAGNDTLYLWSDPDQVFASGNWNNASVGWHGASEAAVETPLANALGIGSFTIYNPESDTKSGSIRVNVDCFGNGGYVKIGEVWAIYEV